MPREKEQLRSSGSLRGWWLFLTDVSGRPVGPILKGQESKRKPVVPVRREWRWSDTAVAASRVTLVLLYSYVQM